MNSNALVERLLYMILLMTFVLVSIGTWAAVKTGIDLKEQTRTIAALQQTQTQLLEQQQKLLDGQAKGIDNVRGAIQCVVTFFGIPDRTNMIIKDYQTCTIENTATGNEQKLTLSPMQMPEQTPAQQPVAHSDAPTNQGSEHSNAPSTPPAENKPEQEHSLPPLDGAVCRLSLGLLLCQ